MIHHFELTASEFDWELSQKKKVRAWGFNKQVPGPVLKARKGDTLFIHVKNELQQPTVIHWHGIRLRSTMDGTAQVQQPIQPRGTFTYEFEVPDAGTFWYHSHQNETEQMEKGMYGALIIEDSDEPVLDNERILMIDDMKLDKDNSFKTGKFISKWKERHDGREGDTLLINGKEDYQIEMNAGQKERWRFINASSARYFRLYLGGRTFTIIGTDGGLIEKPVEVTEVMIVPGERVDVVVGPFNEGEMFYIESLAYNRMTFVKSKNEIFGTVTVKEVKPSKAFIPERLREIGKLAPQEASVMRKVKFSVGPSLKHGIDFLVNGEVHFTDEPVYSGELQVWEISNTSLMDHPFHLHGYFFQVLEENGKPPAYTAWKDTLNLKPRSKAKIAWMPDDRVGEWMYHCHILEHHEAGMMGHFQVRSRDDQAPELRSHHKHHHS